LVFIFWRDFRNIIWPYLGGWIIALIQIDLEVDRNCHFSRVNVELKELLVLIVSVIVRHYLSQVLLLSPTLFLTKLGYS
jgi:hypothetical protein